MTPVTLDSEDNFCRDCAFIATSSSGEWQRFRCMAPFNLLGHNLVSGNKVFNYEFCCDARTDNEFGCGQIGQWFLKREVESFRMHELSTQLNEEIRTASQTSDKLAVARIAARNRLSKKTLGNIPEL